VDFLQVRLLGPPGLDEFYAQFGELPLEFSGGEYGPAYHFAFLVPGDRFEPAFRWAGERFELLPRKDGELVFDFSFWDALACYFADPAGNVVELIAHRGVGENGARGPFSPGELLGFSEVGLVGDVEAMARELEELDLRIWSGSTEPDSLAFVGERARTLILFPVGRGWLPSGERRAASHPVDVTLSGPPEGTLVVNGHRVTRSV
jgi:hypothetical protein